MKLRHAILAGTAGLLSNGQTINANELFHNGTENGKIESILSCSKGDRKILHIGQVHSIGDLELEGFDNTDIIKSQSNIQKVLRNLGASKHIPLVVASEGLTSKPKQEDIKDIIQDKLDGLLNPYLFQIGFDSFIYSRPFQERLEVLEIIEKKCIGKKAEQCSGFFNLDNRLDIFYDLFYSSEVIDIKKITAIKRDLINTIEGIKQDSKRQAEQIIKTITLESEKILGADLKCTIKKECNLVGVDNEELIEEGGDLLEKVNRSANNAGREIRNKNISIKKQDECINSLIKSYDSIYAKKIHIEIDKKCLSKTTQRKLTKMQNKLIDIIHIAREDYAIKSISDNWSEFEKQGFAPLIYGAGHNFKDSIEKWNDENPKKSSFCLSRIY